MVCHETHNTQQYKPFLFHSKHTLSVYTDKAQNPLFTISKTANESLLHRVRHARSFHWYLFEFRTPNSEFVFHQPVLVYDWTVIKCVPCCRFDLFVYVIFGQQLGWEIGYLLIVLRQYH